MGNVWGKYYLEILMFFAVFGASTIGYGAFNVLTTTTEKVVRDDYQVYLAYEKGKLNFEEWETVVRYRSRNEVCDAN